MHTALAAIEPVFKQFNPASPFIYSFIDEEYQKKFNTASRIGNLATVFSGLAILISCLGLFGPASFVAEQRTKEIGVRKVFGPRYGSLGTALRQLHKVGGAVRADLDAPVLLLHGSMPSELCTSYLAVRMDLCSCRRGLLLVTLAPVSYQAVRAALTNSVKSLRTE